MTLLSWDTQASPLAPGGESLRGRVPHPLTGISQLVLKDTGYHVR